MRFRLADGLAVACHSGGQRWLMVIRFVACLIEQIHSTSSHWNKSKITNFITENRKTLENPLRPSPDLLKSLAVTGESESYVDSL